MIACTNWRDDAACRDADPDLFFPIGTSGPVLRQIDEAKRICRACPVQTACLAWAIDHAVTSGVWGGTTSDERRAIRRSAKERPLARKMTMAIIITEQSRQNMEFVRSLLREKQPGFSAALELAVELLRAEPGIPS
jgi:WhiB family redox-sensing transcriptional regulator